MSDDVLLDMDYFLNEDDEAVLVLKGFIFSDRNHPLPRETFSLKVFP